MNGSATRRRRPRPTPTLRRSSPFRQRHRLRRWRRRGSVSGATRTSPGSRQLGSAVKVVTMWLAKTGANTFRYSWRNPAVRRSTHRVRGDGQSIRAKEREIEVPIPSAEPDDGRVVASQIVRGERCPWNGRRRANPCSAGMTASLYDSGVSTSGNTSPMLPRVLIGQRGSMRPSTIQCVFMNPIRTCWSATLEGRERSR